MNPDPISSKSLNLGVPQPIIKSARISPRPGSRDESPTIKTLNKEGIDLFGNGGYNGTSESKIKMPSSEKRPKFFESKVIALEDDLSCDAVKIIPLVLKFEKILIKKLLLGLTFFSIWPIFYILELIFPTFWYNYAQRPDEARHFLVKRSNRMQKMCKLLPPLNSAPFFTKNIRFIFESVLFIYDKEQSVWRQENLGINNFTLEDIKDFIDPNSEHQDAPFTEHLKNLTMLQ